MNRMWKGEAVPLCRAVPETELQGYEVRTIFGEHAPASGSEALTGRTETELIVFHDERG
jgi:hypothetical protein